MGSVDQDQQELNACEAAVGNLLKLLIVLLTERRMMKAVVDVYMVSNFGETETFKVLISV